MKRCLLGLCILLLFSCTAFFPIEEESIKPHNDPNSPDYVPTTFIKIDNTGRYYPVDVFTTSARTNKIATVSANGTSASIEWLPTDHYDFFITYNLPLYMPTISATKIIPYEPNNNASFVRVAPIDRNKTTTVRIHDLQLYTSTSANLFPNNIYLVIKNTGSSAFRLESSSGGGGSTPLQPDIFKDTGTSFVNYNETALYTLPLTTLVSNLKINGVSLPASITSFTGGCVYVIDFNGVSAVLKEQRYITLGNL